MKNFRQRAITGLSFAAVMTAAILYNHWTFFLVFTIITALGLFEFYKLMRSEHTDPQSITGVIIGTIFFLGFSFLTLFRLPWSWMMIAFPVVALIFIAELYRNREHPFLNIAVILTGMIYFMVPLILMVRMAFDITETDVVYRGGLIMGFILILWSSDTGAYMLGSQIGRHRLFERISPKKSWEGFAGAVLSGLFAGWVVSHWFTMLSLTEWLIISQIIVVAGTLGDLVESMLKRSIGVKDSGELFPGHGGILDRFDGLVLSMPFVFTYLFIAGKV